MDKLNPPLARGASYLLIYLTAFQPLHPAFAAGITAANGNTQVVIKPGNVPVVNIATPNGAGISHNTYKDFNVGPQGAVLNNATHGGKTQLGVEIYSAQGNTYLKGKPAELIINEVIGGSRSELQGKLEVFGNKANVMIANPNGITCDGCGFINAPGVTLTTGKPQFDKQGALEALEVKKGGVTIGGKGLDGSGADYVDIISRATELNGKINAQNLSLTQGANRISFKDGSIKPIAGEGAKPQLAVDTKVLGGMYANKIRLVANEDGVGVNLKDLTSKQRDITLSVNGNLVLNGTTHSKGDLNVSARGLHITPGAVVQADGNATLATTTLVNDGQTSTSGDMRIFGDHIRNAGENAKLHANKNMWIQKDAQGNKAKSVENRSAKILTNSGDLVIRTESLNNVRQQFAISSNNAPKDNKDIDRWLADGVYQDQFDYRFFDYLADFEDKNFTWLGHVDFKKTPWVNSERVRFTVVTDSRPAEIISGKNAYINASELWNHVSTIKATNDLILTGNNLGVRSEMTGDMNDYALFEPKVPNPKVVLGHKWQDQKSSIPEYVIYVRKGGQKSWSASGYPSSAMLAGGSLVADFKNQIEIKTSTPMENQLSEVVASGRPDSLAAHNIVLHAGRVISTDKINARNDLTVVADDLFYTDGAELTAGKSLNVAAVNELDARQSYLKGHNVTLTSRNGNVKVHTVPSPRYFGVDGARWLSQLNAAGDLTLNAGQGIYLRNTHFAPQSQNIAMTANGTVSIVRNDEALNNDRLAQNLSPEQRQTQFNQLLNAGQLNASGSVLLNSGGYLALRGTHIKAGKDVTLLAGHNADLNYRELGGQFSRFFPSSRTPELGSRVHAGGNLLINSARDIGTQGGTLSANGNITLLAGQNLWLSNVAYSAIDAANDNNKDDRHVVTTLSTGKNLTAAANNQLLTYGARLTSGANMALTSGGDMRFEAVQNHTYREGGHEFTETRTQQGTELNAGGLMTVISGGSILFQATKLVVKGLGANWKSPVAVTDWGSRIAVAEQQLQNAQQRINQAQQDKSRAEQAKHGKSNELTTLQRDINSLKQRQAEVIKKSQEFTAKHGKLMEINDWGLWQQSAAIAAEGIGITHDLLEKEKRANALPNEINAEQSALNDAQQRLSQATQDRDGAQSRLATARNEATSKGADEAKQKAQVDAHNQAEAMRAGNMDIAAKGGYLYAQAMEESSHYEKTEKKRKWWGKKTEVKQTRHDVTNKVTEFTAAGNITLMSRDDSTYEASKIAAGQNARLTSMHGQVNFRAVKNTSFEQTVSNSKGFFIKQANKGYEDNKWVLPSIHTGGALIVEAAKGVSADVKVKNGQALQSAIDALGNTPGTTWVKDLNKRNDVQWSKVKDAYDSWDYKSQHLNPAVAAVIAIAAAAVTAGSSLAATAASSVSGAVGGGAVTSGAVTAGMSSLASQAAVALVENQGNLSKTLQALGSNENVKATATAMAIGGALNGFDSAMGWSKDAAGKPLNPNNVKLPQLNNGDWSKVAQRVAGQSVISSSLNTAINGGSFKDNLTNALLANIGSQVQAEGANLIGDNGDVLGAAGKSVSHAVVAGIAAEIGRGDGKGAAAGALAAELAGVVMQSTLFEPTNLNEKERQLYRLQEALNGNEVKEQTARVIGALTGALTTHTPEGAYSAADSAQSVYRYNMTEHMLMQYALDNQKDILAADKGDVAAAKRVVARREAAAIVATVGGGGLVLTAGGMTLVGAAPELVLAARLAIAGCKTNPALCLNQAGIYAADIVAPEAIIGTGAVTTGSTLILGKTEDSVRKLSRQLVNASDELYKTKTLNTQPVADFIKGETAAGASLSTKTADYLREIQKVNTNQLVKVFDPKQNESKLNVFGQQFEQVLGEGGSNKQGNTKVFATENLSKQAIFDYAQSLTGGKPLIEVRKDALWTVVLNEKTGEKLTLRSVSSSKEDTKARWTIDIIDNEHLNALQGKVKKRVEIKFR
ncbi:TPA: filamentous hemagglutinin N-terminal domain-containing protein [Serratia marcescens]|nr:filamentous hemagglutinin N-terminal domain-containing protein [Serratia marcescens]HAT5032280.1 filamentous hemagglutinin N-terminal domain-containing protein [Serratia marcescens]